LSNIVEYNYLYCISSCTCTLVQFYGAVCIDLTASFWWGVALCRSED